MKKQNDPDFGASMLLILLCIPLFALGAWYGYCRASAQAEVYRRAGIEMSPWEVWLGAKPPERVIRIRD